MPKPAEKQHLECSPDDVGVSESARGQVKTAEPPYLTALQVSELLQVDEKTVLRWSLEDASMPVLRRGRVVRFPRERLVAWLERQEPRSARRSAQGQRKTSTA
jgi:excisionase family DNA binding protein